jgi:hypothetical protein
MIGATGAVAVSYKYAVFGDTVTSRYPEFIRGLLWPDFSRRIRSSGGLGPRISVVKASTRGKPIALA